MDNIAILNRMINTHETTPAVEPISINGNIPAQQTLHSGDPPPTQLVWQHGSFSLILQDHELQWLWSSKCSWKTKDVWKCSLQRCQWSYKKVKCETSLHKIRGVNRGSNVLELDDNERTNCATLLLPTAAVLTVRTFSVSLLSHSLFLYSVYHSFN